MPQQCLTIQDTETGKFMGDYNAATGTFDWVTDEIEAHCFTNENDRQAVLDLLNAGGGSRFVGPHPKPPKP